MKNTWIVTTGSSDIYLKHNKNWAKVFRKARPKIGSCPVEKSPRPSGGFSLASRSLGRIYGENPEYFDDLEFPLWDCLLDCLEVHKKQLHRIIVLLTDQEAIFPKQNDLPFWKDTIECKPLFERYLERHNWSKNIKPEFLIITPTEQEKGLDHWDGILELVQKTLAETECEEEETIYVSHQAGTPAVSSALQFVSLARFGSAVKFLVTNEYDAKNTKPIEGSKYLRALQLQKAKQLIKKGIPGAALELIEEIEPPIQPKLQEKLQEYVDIFNIKATVLAKGVKPNEFKPDNAGKRIRQALDIVEFFFQQENYLAGITLLIATQETFLKAAIMKLVRELDDRFSEFLRWDKRGFSLQSGKMLDKMDKADIVKTSPLNFCSIVSFLELKEKEYIKFDNSKMLEWLKKLIEVKSKRNDWCWQLLDWSCFYYKEHELDRRNQLVHNLRGIEKVDVLCYLESYTEKSKKETEKEHEEMRKKWELLPELPTVKSVYLKEIKQPFVQILCDVGLCDPDDNAKNFLAEDLKKLSDRIQ